MLNTWNSRVHVQFFLSFPMLTPFQKNPPHEQIHHINHHGLWSCDHRMIILQNPGKPHGRCFFEWNLDGMMSIQLTQHVKWRKNYCRTVARCQRFSSFALVTVAAEMQLGASCASRVASSTGSMTMHGCAWTCSIHQNSQFQWDNVEKKWEKLGNQLWLRNPQDDSRTLVWYPAW